MAKKSHPVRDKNDQVYTVEDLLKVAKSRFCVSRDIASAAWKGYDDLTVGEAQNLIDKFKKGGK